MCENRDDPKYEEGNWYRPAAAQHQEALIEANHGARIRVGKRRTPNDYHHGEGGDKGIDAQPCDLHAIEKTGQPARKDGAQ